MFKYVAVDAWFGRIDASYPQQRTRSIAKSDRRD
jgi:hypothetical protein